MLHNALQTIISHLLIPALFASVPAKLVLLTQFALPALMVTISMVVLAQPPAVGLKFQLTTYVHLVTQHAHCAKALFRIAQHAPQDTCILMHFIVAL